MPEHEMRQRAATAVLWFFLVMAMFGSLTHTAWLFALREGQTPVGQVIGYVIAVSIDAGLVGVTYGLRQRKQQKRPARFLYLASLLIIAVSIYANFAHAFAQDVGQEMTRGGWQEVDPYRLLTSAVVSIPLPLLVLALAETVSDDVAWSVERAEREARRHGRPERAGQDEPGGLATLGTLTVANEVRAANRDEARAALVDYYRANPTASHRQAAQVVGRSHSWVTATLAELEQAGLVRRSEGVVTVLAELAAPVDQQVR